MAFYESKKTGIEEDQIIQGVRHGTGIVENITAYSSGLYQIICGGVTAKSGGGNIHVLLNGQSFDYATIYPRDHDYRERLVAFVFCQLNKGDVITLDTENSGNCKIVYTFQRVG